MEQIRLMTHSLRAAPWGERVAQIMAQALDAVEPAAAVERYLRREGDTLLIDGQRYDLRRYERVLLVGMGKAGTPMARAAAGIVGDRLAGGAVVVKDLPHEPHPPGVELLAAGHPIPDERGVAAAGRIAALLERAGERDLVLALISGGGSALLPLPVTGVQLAEVQQLTGLLLGCGASINEINTLRKHLEQLKGGGLARMAAPATLATLVLSDVVGNPLDVIASGPTVPDSSSFGDAYAVLEQYGLTEQAPTALLRHLRAGVDGEIADTPKAGDPLFARVQNVVIGSNQQAAAAALEAARAAGMHTLLLSTFVQGEAREVGRVLAAVARQLASDGADIAAPLPRPACVVLGGETTVTLRGSGRGGRNQELALGAVNDMAGLRDVALVALATDGGDGPTDAAGAVVTGETLERARGLGISTQLHLGRNDAYPFFDMLDDLLRPGPTETNVNDLAFVFAL
jgi:hydroxypyruvate reductase